MNLRVLCIEAKGISLFHKPLLEGSVYTAEKVKRCKCGCKKSMYILQGYKRSVCERYNVEYETERFIPCQEQDGLKIMVEIIQETEKL